MTATDARLVFRYCVGKQALTVVQQQAADVTVKGRVSTADARQILRYAVGKLPALS